MKHSRSLAVILAFLAVFTQASPMDGGEHHGADNDDCGDIDPQHCLTLIPSVIATEFEHSTNNFINFCATVPNLPITNGKQIKTGSCNPAPMGVIAASTNMPSAKFVFPKNFGTIKSNTPFTIELAVKHLDTGFFTNPDENFLSAPQTVDHMGDIKGYSSVVIEKLQSLAQTTPTDPTAFAFFKSITDHAEKGVLSTTVTNGLPVGFYRLASINSAANHQPALVAIAQHGALDDMVYFTVTV